MTSQPAASCSTSSSRPFQTPVEEFRSLFRTGTASSTSIPRFRRFLERPRGHPYVASRTGRCTGSHSHWVTSTSTAASPGAGSKVQQTSFCREVVLLNDPQDVSVVRGARKANLHGSGNVLSAFMFNKSRKTYKKRRRKAKVSMVLSSVLSVIFFAAAPRQTLNLVYTVVVKIIPWKTTWKTSAVHAISLSWVMCGFLTFFIKGKS